MSRTHTLRPGAPSRQVSGLRRWREGKVRRIPGSSPHDRLVSRVISSSPRGACDDPFHATGFRISQESYWAPSMRFQRHGGIYLVRWGSTAKPSQNQILGRDQTASRWSAPSPGKRTRREEHALSHRPQMSSGRLFLDRVGRHQSPSPLRRHAQTTTHFPRGTSKPELSTLLGSGTFYFA